MTQHQPSPKFECTPIKPKHTDNTHQESPAVASTSYSLNERLRQNPQTYACSSTEVRPQQALTYFNPENTTNQVNGNFENWPTQQTSVVAPRSNYTTSTPIEKQLSIGSVVSYADNPKYFDMSASGSSYMDISGGEARQMTQNNDNWYTDAFSTVYDGNWRSTEYQDPPNLQTSCHSCCDGIAEMKNELSSLKHDVERLKKRLKVTLTFLVYFYFNPVLLVARDTACSWG